jgi:putative endopeptidase
MANKLEEYIDKSVNPANDFFAYANGKWIQNNTIPPDESKWGTFYELREESYKKARTITEGIGDGFAPGSNEYLVKHFYNSGVDLETSEQAAAVGIKRLYNRIDEIKNTESLIEALGWLHAQGVYCIWFPYVEPDEKNSDKYIFRIHQSGLGLPDRDYYLKDDPAMKVIREKYGEYLPKIYGFYSGDEQASKAVPEIITIERTLAENSDTKVEQRDVERQYNKFTPKTLGEFAPKVNWGKYFQNLGIPVPDELILDQPKFIGAVEGLINSENLDNVKEYLKWQTTLLISEALGEKFQAVFFEFYGKVLEGKLQLQPRWKRVIIQMGELIGEALGKFFVEKYFPVEAKTRMDQLVEDLRSAFADRIQALDWMEEETKKYAIYKLSKVRVKIGYPNKWRDYSSIPINPNSYFENCLEAAKFETRRKLNKLGSPIDREEWLMTPHTVNAYAYFHLNEITFPAGILQPPFFDFEADDALNYGGIGAVIGHELTHGFDDMGSQFDDKGMLRNWRAESDKKNFEDRTKVMVNLADNYEVLPGLKINGKLTLGENIADLGGVEIAFLALQKAWKRNGKPELIEGFTPEQRFFLNYARTEASAYREEKMREQIATDPHSPGIFRVNGILKNITAFHNAFGVTEVDPMFLPETERAKIW